VSRDLIYPARTTIILSSVACPSLPYFFTLYHTTTRFSEKDTAYQICVLIFCMTYVWKFSHSKNN